MNYPHPAIAREGWPFIALSIVLALGTSFVFDFMIAAPFWLLVIFVVQFFRDPPREIAGDAKTVVSPADGRIIVVERTTDPYLQREAIKISVFMNVFNVHSQRSPIDGEVKARWYKPGKFFNAALDKASYENERNALYLITEDGQEVTCVQVAGLVARRILCYVEPGARLARGERYGFIRFGSRLDVYLPATARVEATIGQKVYASSTILAKLA